MPQLSITLRRIAATLCLGALAFTSGCDMLVSSETRIERALEISLVGERSRYASPRRYRGER